VEFNVSSDKDMFNSIREQLAEFAQERELVCTFRKDSFKTSGVQMLRVNCDIKNDLDRWQEFIQWHQQTAIELRQTLAELGL